jgi:hypothetical protein
MAEIEFGDLEVRLDAAFGQSGTQEELGDRKAHQPDYQGQGGGADGQRSDSRAPTDE